MAAGKEGVNRIQRALIDTVRAAMVEADFSQSDIAWLTGMSEKHVSQMMSGRIPGTLNAWQRITDAVGVEGVSWKPEDLSPPAERKGRPGPYRCLIEGCQSTPQKHRAVLWQHLKLTHQMGMPEYIKLFGEPEPMTPAEVEGLVVEIKCELCPQVYSTADGIRWPRSAWITHMWSTHSIKVH